MTIDQFRTCAVEIAETDEHPDVRAAAAHLARELADVKDDDFAAFQQATRTIIDQARAEKRMVGVAHVYQRIQARYGDEVFALISEVHEKLKTVYAAQQLAALQTELSFTKPLVAEQLDSIYASLAEARQCVGLFQSALIDLKQIAQQMERPLIEATRPDPADVTEAFARLEALQAQLAERRTRWFEEDNAILDKADRASQTLSKAVSNLRDQRAQGGDVADRALMLLRYEVRRFLTARQFPDDFFDRFLLSDRFDHANPLRSLPDTLRSELGERERELLLAAASAALAWVHCHREESKRRQEKGSDRQAATASAESDASP